MKHYDTDQTLAVDSMGLARALDVSVRHIQRMDTGGHLPRAVRFGRAKRWLVETIQEWLRAGSPPRDQWETMQRNNKKGTVDD